MKSLFVIFTWKNYDDLIINIVAEQFDLIE